MGADGRVLILDKSKAEEWSSRKGVKLLWYGWYEYDIYGHRVMVAYYGDYPVGLEYVPCPFCELERDCENESHYQLLDELINYSCVGDWEVWT